MYVLIVWTIFDALAVAGYALYAIHIEDLPVLLLLLVFVEVQTQGENRSDLSDDDAIAAEALSTLIGTTTTTTKPMNQRHQHRVVRNVGDLLLFRCRINYAQRKKIDADVPMNNDY